MSLLLLTRHPPSPLQYPADNFNPVWRVRSQIQREWGGEGEDQRQLVLVTRFLGNLSCRGRLPIPRWHTRSLSADMRPSTGGDAQPRGRLRKERMAVGRITSRGYLFCCWLPRRTAMWAWGSCLTSLNLSLFIFKMGNHNNTYLLELQWGWNDRFM